jgi:DNA replication and repair protein RecF
MEMGVHEVRRGVDLAVLPRHGERIGVTRLALTDFRNYRTARLDLAAGPVVLTGPNGAGKTNLLEAVSVLSPGRGLRNARLGDFDRRHSDGEPEMRPAGELRGWAPTAARRGSALPISAAR